MLVWVFSAMPSAAAAWNRPAFRFRSMYSAASPTGKPPRRAEQREPYVLEGDGVAARGAHAERVPVVVNDNTRRLTRNHRVAVSLTTAFVGVGGGGVEDVGGRGHRAEDFATGDDPPVLGAGRSRGRPGEVLPELAAGGSEHRAVFSDLPERRSERPRASLVVCCQPRSASGERRSGRRRGAC